MQPECLITQLPLAELWTSSGPLLARRDRYLNLEALRQLLQSGAVEFVVANVGHKLNWVSAQDSFLYWKTEVRQHLVNDPDKLMDVHQYSHGYCYVASQWQVVGRESSIVVLECHH
jgi:hypothetical protein